jgi:hypothetical protein
MISASLLSPVIELEEHPTQVTCRAFEISAMDVPIAADIRLVLRRRPGITEDAIRM